MRALDTLHCRDNFFDMLCMQCFGYGIFFWIQLVKKADPDPGRKGKLSFISDFEYNKKHIFELDFFKIREASLCNTIFILRSVDYINHI